VRRELLKGHYVTLRSGPTTPLASAPDPLGLALFPDEILRESKQILRSVYFACAPLTSQDIPPPITERRQLGGGVLCEMTLAPKIAGADAQS
jgi:hypothetical protein